MLAIAHREEPRANIVDKERPLMVGPDNTATLNDMWSQHKSQRSLRL